MEIRKDWRNWKNMKKATKFIYFLAMFFLFTCINFYFSNLITYKLAHGWQFSCPVFKLVYVENTGAAFSILQNSTNFLIILSIIALVISFYVALKNIEDIYFKGFLFLSILTSGILGNLVERLMFGHVRDFFNLTFVNFPIFNISDIFINIGVFGIIILILLSKKPIKLL
jgi:signal peptidase II